MKKVYSITLLLALTSLFSITQAQDIFLKVIAPPGGDYGGLIKGGSTNQGHENEIKVLSYSQGMASCAPNFNGGAGGQSCKPSIGNMNFMMLMSPGVNQLKYFLLTGIRLVSADFVFEKSTGDGSTVYYRIRMEDIVVVSIQESSGGEVPTVSVELAAPRIAWATYNQSQNGNTTLANKLGYNLATNTFWTYNF